MGHFLYDVCMPLQQFALAPADAASSLGGQDYDFVGDLQWVSQTSCGWVNI